MNSHNKYYDVYKHSEKAHFLQNNIENFKHNQDLLNIYEQIIDDYIDRKLFYCGLEIIIKCSDIINKIFCQTSVDGISHAIFKERMIKLKYKTEICFKSLIDNE